jgi:hypothetical protein
MANAEVIICMAALDQGRVMMALRSAREAAEFAEATENRRLQARALVWLGTVLLDPFINDAIEADRLCIRATELLQPEAIRGASDYLLNDLRELRRTIDRHDAGESRVSSLTSGQIRGKRLRTILDSVAREVILHVYRQNGSNAAVTAKELGINAERVRRLAGPVRTRSK